MDNLRQSNRALQAQVYVYFASCRLHSGGTVSLIHSRTFRKQLQASLAQMNEDHVEIVKQLGMLLQNLHR